MVSQFRNLSTGINPFFHGGICLLRIGLSTVMLTIHGLPLSVAAWKYIWKKQPWDLVEAMTAFQYPAIISTSAALVLTIFPASIIMGFLSRIASAILIVFLVAILVAVKSLEGFISQESIFLYLVGYSTIIITGSGMISMDAVFRHRF